MKPVCVFSPGRYDSIPVIETQLDPSEGRWFARVFYGENSVYVTGEYLRKIDAEVAAKRWIKKMEDANVRKTGL